MKAVSSEPPRIRRFRDWRLGLFLHWGVYAVPARGEWAMFNERIPHAEYRRFAARFRAARFDPAAWAAAARAAGMKYLVLTARHHDGFSLFDSRVSDFTAARSAAGRDLVAEYVKACRAAGLGVGLYYSLIDWRYRAALGGPVSDRRGWNRMVDYVHAQVEELCTGYGPLDILWYDGGAFGPKAWRSRALNAMVRRHQPQVVINNRSGLPEDFDTPEQVLDASATGRMWESCFTMNDSWGYHAADGNWKSLRQVVNMLAVCASYNGNLLLNVGPRADGTFPPASVRILKGLGAWMRRHPEWLHGTRGNCREPILVRHFTTSRGDTVYCFLPHWPDGTLNLAGPTTRVRRARVLSTGQRCRVSQRGDRIILAGLPRRAPDPTANVIALEFERPPAAAPPRPLGEA